MIRKRAQIIAMLLVMICLVCPLIESLDVWHGTFDDGNDTEFALVIAALCVGVSYMAVRLMCRADCVASIFSTGFAGCSERTSAFISTFSLLRIAATGPPLLPLRI